MNPAELYDVIVSSWRQLNALIVCGAVVGLVLGIAISTFRDAAKLRAR